MEVKPQKMAPVVRPYIPVNKIESSMLQAFGYDAQRKVLRAVFKNGVGYDYDDVPAELADSLAKAESAGKFINQYIARRFTTHKLETLK
jgi:hypothetical protein